MSDHKNARVLPFRPRPSAAAAPLRETAPLENAGEATPGTSAPETPARSTAQPDPTRYAVKRPESNHHGDVTPLRRHRGPRIRHSRLPPVLRFGRPFLAAVAIIVGPILLAFWIFRSGVFAVETLDVTIEGEGRVADAWVRQVLKPVEGWNLPRLPLSWVDETLRRHPWIEATSLTKRLPDRLGVRVVERREVALGRIEGDEGERLWYLDAGGHAIDVYESTDGKVDLPLVSAVFPGTPEAGQRDLRPALALYDEIVEIAPEWAGGLSEIEMLSDEDFRVWSADLPFPLLVRSGTLAHKTSFLEELRPEIVRRYARIGAVDLRFSKKIILQTYQRGLGG